MFLDKPIKSIKKMIAKESVASVGFQKDATEIIAAIEDFSNKFPKEASIVTDGTVKTTESTSLAMQEVLKDKKEIIEVVEGLKKGNIYTD